MNWLDTQMAVLDSAMSAVEFAVNWLLQSTLLIGVGLTMGRLLRQRGSAVQSVVYRTTLVAVLICPFATWGLSQAGVSGWSIELPKDWGRQRLDGGIAEVDKLGPATAPAIPTEEFPYNSDEELAGSAPPNGPLPKTTEARAVATGSLAEESVGPLPVDVSISVLGLVALVAIVIWLCVSVALTTRLATAWGRLRRLRRRAVRADEITINICHELASRLAVPAPDVLRCPYLPSPCLAGIRQPAMLLPEIDQGLSIREVLIHELAHLKRHDCHWNLLRQIAAAVFFFQPLLWKLSRRLEATAEEVCDDYVVELGGDRQDYAHRLVDIAELSSAPIAAACVGIVSLRSMLAKRVSRIMDTSRTLSTRVGNLLLVALISGGLIVTTIAGLVGLGPQPKPPRVKAAATGAKRTSDAEKSFTIRGRIDGPDGKPFTRARVTLLYPSTDKNRYAIHTKSGADGRFQLVFKKSQLVGSMRKDPWTVGRVVATARGFGAEWTEPADVTKAREVNLKLHRDVPLHGRILNLEGKPIAGAKLRIRSIAEPKNRSLDEYVKAVPAGEHHSIHFARHLFEIPGQPAEWTTDADGRFEVHGLGAERVVMLNLEHPSVHHYWITAITRGVKKIDPPRDSPRLGDRYGVYGATFEHLATPGRTIRGVVRDKETGQPIAGVRVRSTSTGSHATSDENGRYELQGCRKQRRHRVEAVPFEEPYFSTSIQVTDTGGLGPIDHDLELVQGIQVSGRVTDKKTGKPVSGAAVHYSPLYPNEHAATLGDTIGRPCSQALIQPDGSYAITVLPGPGVVAAQAFAYYERYMPALVTRDDLAKHFKGVKVPDLHNERVLSVYSGRALSALSQKNYNAMKLIDPAEDAKELSLDLVLDPGVTLPGKLIDENGKPVTGASAIGLTSHVFHVNEIKTDSFEVRAINPRRGRHLLFYHKERNLGAVADLTGKESTPLSVKMQPCGAVSGRLLDADNEPRDGVTIECNRERTSGGPGNVWAKTDSKGRFRIEGLVPGQKYSVRIANSRAFALGQVVVESGETKDLGKVNERLP